MVKRAKAKKPADYIVSLYMNGLQGRMLRLPPPRGKKREILLVYGHHASIERMFGVAEDLNQYGGVTLPDLPGFGGMESFYKIGEKPTLDNLADYLAAFVKLRYKRQRLTIAGISLGFVIATRMLQKYPEIAKRVDLIISMAGFVHKDDFKFKRRNYLIMRYGSSIFSRRLPAWTAQHVFLRPSLIRRSYKLVEDSHSKLFDADAAERERRINFEITLWQQNDIRTYMDTTVSMLTLDILPLQVNVPIYHITVGNDRYFDNRIVEQHLHVIYNDVHIVKSRLPAHVPTIVADAASAAPFVPPKIRRILATA